MFNRVQLSLTITLLSLGILMSVQFRTTQEALKSLTAQTQQDLAVTLNFNTKVPIVKIPAYAFMYLLGHAEKEGYTLAKTSSANKAPFA